MSQVQAKAQPRRVSKIGMLARGAAISQANRARAERNARRGGKAWTAKEMKIVQDLYPDYQAILQRLPHRTLAQCKKFTSNYKIATARKQWTAAELTQMKSDYKSGVPIKEMMEKYQCNHSQISGQMSHYGISRPKRAQFVSVGVPVLDEIRQKCLDEGYSLLDLDEWCNSKRYWSKRCYTGAMSLRAIEAALKILGGRLSVVWAEGQTD